MNRPRGAFERARAARRREGCASPRAAAADPLDPKYYADPGSGFMYPGGGRSTGGMTVTPDTALTVGAVYRAVRLLADDVAQLPLHLFKLLPDREGGPGGKERVRDPIADVISKRPNERQTSFEFRRMLMAHALLRGNGYARIVPGARGAIDQLLPLNPAKTRAELLDNGRKLYLHRTKAGREERLTHDEVFHLCGFSTDPESAEGMSVVSLARAAIGLTMSTEEFGARQFSQTPQMRTLLSHPAKLDDEVSKRIARTFREANSGPSGWGGVAVLEEGMTAVQVGMTNDDAQFLATRQFQVTDVARWFCVPPHKIGDLSRATFSNIEEENLNYLIHSLMPWLVLWEQSIERDLILDDAFPQFSVDGLLRGDSLARAQAYQLYINMRAMTPNEVRARENMNPVKGGDEMAMPQGAPAPPSAEGIRRPRPTPPRDEDDDAAGANRVAPHLNGSARHG